MIKDIISIGLIGFIDSRFGPLGTSNSLLKPSKTCLKLRFNISQERYRLIYKYKMKTSIKLLTLLFTAALATGCGGGGKGGNTSTSSGGDFEDNFTFNSDELETAQVIHTQDQANFLNYQKDTGKSYYEITSSELNGFNARGNTNVSTPNKVTLNWDYEADDEELERFDVTFGQEEDLSDGYVVKGTKERTIKFYNPYIGDNYFKVTAIYKDGGEEDSDIKVFKVEDIAPRNLYAGNMPNVRDMGGRTTYAGGRIKQGLIYRGAGNRFDNSSQIDAECQDRLTNQLKIKTEINVANSTSNNINLSGTTVQDCFMAYGSVPYSNLARNSVRIRQIMDILSNEENYPVFYHCRIGTDRTGITGMMINGLLGVTFDECLQDYLFSNFAPIDNQRYPHKESDPNGDDIAKYIDAIKELPGANFQEQVYLALRMIGCSAEQLDKIIDIMTIGEKANIPDSFKVGMGDELTSSASKKTATDYKTPASYYPVSANGNVQYKVTTTAGSKDVIVYLGTTQSVTTSTSTKLSASLVLKIDGNEQTITSTKNLWTAGFGSTQQDNRYGYMFNVLGNYNFTAAEHTIEIGVKSGSFNIASIGVADR